MYQLKRFSVFRDKNPGKIIINRPLVSVILSTESFSPISKLSLPFLILAASLIDFCGFAVDYVTEFESSREKGSSDTRTVVLFLVQTIFGKRRQDGRCLLLSEKKTAILK